MLKINNAFYILIFSSFVFSSFLCKDEEELAAMTEIELLPDGGIEAKYKAEENESEDDFDDEDEDDNDDDRDE